MEIGTESGSDLPVYVIVECQSQAKTGSNQEQTNSNFQRLDLLKLFAK